VACLSSFVFSLTAFADSVHPDIEAAIKAQNARWAQAYARGDYQEIGRLYTKEGSLLPPGGKRIIGAAAISDYFTKASAGFPPDTVSFSNYEFYGDNEVVTEVSDTDVYDHTGQLKYRGKQILIFLKHDGVWKLHRDIWNDSAP